MNALPRVQPKLCEPIYVVDESILYRLEIRSDQEWMNLPTDLRPGKVFHVPRLGWIGLVPICEMDGNPPAPSAPDRRRA